MWRRPRETPDRDRQLGRAIAILDIRGVNYRRDRKIFRQYAPWAAGTTDIKNGVHRRAQFRTTPALERFAARHVGLDRALFRVARTACLAAARTRGLRTSDFSPHVAPHRLRPHSQRIANDRNHSTHFKTDTLSSAAKRRRPKSPPRRRKPPQPPRPGNCLKGAGRRGTRRSHRGTPCPDISPWQRTLYRRPDPAAPTNCEKSGLSGKRGGGEILQAGETRVVRAARLRGRTARLALAAVDPHAREPRRTRGFVVVVEALGYVEDARPGETGGGEPVGEEAEGARVRLVGADVLRGEDVVERCPQPDCGARETRPVDVGEDAEAVPLAERGEGAGAVGEGRPIARRGAERRRAPPPSPARRTRARSRPAPPPGFAGRARRAGPAAPPSRGARMRPAAPPRPPASRSARPRGGAPRATPIPSR